MEENRVDVSALSELIERESHFLDLLESGMSRVIVGQKHLRGSLLIGLLADGHLAGGCSWSCQDFGD